MRFHMGVSFSWRTIKKFLFPFILGLLAYFGFDLLNNGFIQVNALENYDTTFNLNYVNMDLFNKKIDDNITFNEFFNNVNSISSNYYKLIFTFSSYIEGNNSFIPSISIFTIPISTSSINISIFSQSFYLNYRFNSSSAFYAYNFDLVSDNVSDIYSTTSYINLVNCLTNNSCTGRRSYSNSNFTFGSTLYTTTNELSYDVSFPYSLDNLNNFSAGPRSIFYSQVPLVFVPEYNLSNSSYFYKNLNINDIIVSNGDYFLTYKDYIDSIPDEPDEPDVPDVPSEDTTEHKALFNKIYWFDDNSTSLGVLTSIYEVLFLYCLTMILFKILTFLKNKRW